jgi:hypothetical protein
MPRITCLSIGLSFLVATSFSYAAFAADTKSCPYGKANVAGFGCVSIKEIAKAKKNCMKLKPPTKDFTQCLCQDGSQVGACGD